MNDPSQVLSVFAQERISKVVFQIIRKLQSFTETLSGNDSGLANIWDEICVQIQGEESIHWEVYEETLLNLIEKEVNKMPTHERYSIWLQTESATSYDEEEDDLSLKYDPIEVCHDIKNIIFQKAEEWNNKRIRKYLER